MKITDRIGHDLIFKTSCRILQKQAPKFNLRAIILYYIVLNDLQTDSDYRVAALLNHISGEINITDTYFF